MSLYEHLHIQPNATSVDIKKAFHKLSRELHPDKNTNDNTQDKTAKEEQFKKIVHAYSILSKEDKRRHYDLVGDDEKTGEYNVNSFNQSDFERTVEEYFTESGIGNFFQTMTESFGMKKPFSTTDNFMSMGINMSHMNDDEMMNMVNGVAHVTHNIQKIITTQQHKIPIYISLDELIDGCRKKIEFREKVYTIRIHPGIPNNKMIMMDKNSNYVLIGIIKYKIQDELPKHIKYIDKENNVFLNIKITLFEYFCGFVKKLMLGPRAIEIIHDDYLDINNELCIRNKGIPVYKKNNKYTDVWITFQIIYPGEKVFKELRKLFQTLTNTSENINHTHNHSGMSSDDEQDNINIIRL